MYTVGLQSAADAFLVSSFKVQVVLALLILFVLLVVGHGSSKDGLSAQTPVYLPGSHLLAIAPFFRRRFDFLNDGFRKTGEKLFQFNMLRVRAPSLGLQCGLLTSSPGDRHRRIRGVGTKSFFREQGFRSDRRVQGFVWCGMCCFP